jgi:hypothetical protein
MLCAGKLSDRQAADAVRARLDRKYLLGLGLTDPGLDQSVLSELRKRHYGKQSKPLENCVSVGAAHH